MNMLIAHWWLLPVVFGTSIITAVTGAGGGVLLLGLMGLALPVGAVIPLHGSVMFLQNGFRGLLLWDKVDWPFVGIAVIGSIVGAFLAGPVAVNLPDMWLQLVLGVGLLYLVWAPKPKKPLVIPGISKNLMTLMMAVLISILTVIIGAAGVLFSAIRRRGGHAKEEVLADQSIIMFWQHILKMVVFTLAGFSFGPYLPLVGGMIVMGLLGTWVGVSLMKRMETVWFDRMFRTVVTMLALIMLGKATQIFG